jgi:hypothetical protein
MEYRLVNLKRAAIKKAAFDIRLGTGISRARDKTYDRPSRVTVQCYATVRKGTCMSIYSNLFRYRPRPQRSPHEDFLTAALADILNRVPREISAEFVADILLAGHEGRQAWLEFLGRFPEAPFRWATQVGVRHHQGGVLDLLLLVDGKEAIIVENKIGAVVREHKTGLAESDEEVVDLQPVVSVANATQLTTYGKWLASRCANRPWPGALILLTHYSVAPADFGGQSPGDYGVPFLRVCRWSMIWRWAKKIGAPIRNDAVLDARPSWMDLSHELAEFLEDENMTSDCMTLHDLAAVELFVGSAQRVERTFAVVRERLSSVKDGLATGRFNGPNYTSAGGVVWCWFYLTEPQKIRGNWHFGWGIRFPAVSEWWLGCIPPLPGAPHAFLTLSTDDSPLPVSSLKPSEIPAGWIVTPQEEHLLIVKPLYEFRPDAEGLAADFGEWVAVSMQSIRPALATLTGSLVQP